MAKDEVKNGTDAEYDVRGSSVMCNQTQGVSLMLKRRINPLSMGECVVACAWTCLNKGSDKMH